MKYKWQIICIGALLISNIISITFVENITLAHIIAYLANLLLGWFIGYFLDKYTRSKKELGSTKTVLIDYSHALDSVPDGIGITNEKNQFEFVNKAHATLYGYSKEELLEKKWNDCYSKKSINHLNGVAVPQLLKCGEWRGELIGVRKDGSTFPQEIAVSRIKDTGKFICVIRDISEQKQYVEYVKHIANHNDLTMLPNRRKLLSEASKILKESMNTSMLFVDLDRFKMVNDTLGHDIGDDLLVIVAERLKSFENKLINVYHLGGDEFIILIQNSSIDFVEKTAREIIDSIKKPYSINGNEVIITTSIGISRYPEHTEKFDELMKMADTAMYYAKLDGKNTYKFFAMDLKVKMERNALVESELRKAIDKQELYVHYQPKFCTKSFQIVGMEALLRWENSTLGSVSPEEFIAIAEDTGLINDIGNWVINEVLMQMNKWHEKGYLLVKVSVNVSQRQFRDRKLVHFIKNCLDTYKIDPAYLEIEITESVMEEVEVVIPQLNLLKELGIGISIDDFGTGYSSLNFIKDLPANTIKIDQSFIRGIDNENNRLLVRTIIEIGSTLKLNVVAEGIETEEHLNMLNQLGCPIGQGYFLSKPLNAEEVEERFLKKL